MQIVTVLLAAVPLVVGGVTPEEINDGEVSVGAEVRFDRLPTATALGGFFPLAVDADGVVTVTMPAKKGDLIGDMPFRTKAKVGKGEWHHVAFTFSRQQRRFVLWLDGELQFENHMQWLPALEVKGGSEEGRREDVGFWGRLFGKDDGSFKGEVRNLAIHDCALPSEYLVPAKDPEGAVAKARKLLEGALKAKNGDLVRWAKEILEKAGRRGADGTMLTERDVTELLRDAGHAAKIAAENGDVAGVGAVMTTDLYSQEMITPFVLPRDGAFSGKIEVACAKDESETASVVVMAYRPLKNVRLKLTGMPSEVDLKLVKRIYCTGGAWMTYHRDPRLRFLTPCLMINDDRLIRVDERKMRNYLRLDYPANEGGTVYADVTDPDAPVEVFRRGVPFNDAATLQPVDIPAAGRNQQFTLCFRAGKDAKPGLYRGVLEITSDQGLVGRLSVAYRVLPFELPLPKSYDNLAQTYYSDVNGIREWYGDNTYAGRRKQAYDVIRNCIEHNARHVNGMFANETAAAIAKELGTDTAHLFEFPSLATPLMGIGRGDWRTLYEGLASDRDYKARIDALPDDAGTQPGRKQFDPKYWKLLDSKDKEKAMALIARSVKQRTDLMKSVDPEGEPMSIFWSESAAYVNLADKQRQQADLAHALGHRVFAHGHSPNMKFAADVQDMNSASGNMRREDADFWHAGGGAVMSYCFPFPSAENPAMFRRWNGLERYKTARYDGSMQHGLVTAMYDEFRDDPGGDGNYRNFAVAYRAQKGLLWTIAWEGWREAYDDVRYATYLKQLCTPYLAKLDSPLRGEARRCLLWLERIDGQYTDMNMFRAGVIHRILNFLEAKKRVESGKWKMESGKWKVESGKWKVENGKWGVGNG